MPYNGWSNYETWNVKLWMDNDEGNYRYWQDETERAITDTQDKDDAIKYIAEQVEAQHKEGMPELAGTYADLMNAALSEVDWYEIAESLVGGVLANNPELLEAS